MQHPRLAVLQVNTATIMGGTEVMLLELMPAIAQDRYGVALVCSPNPGLENGAEALGVPTYVMARDVVTGTRGLAPLRVLRALIRLYGVVKQVRPDVLHTQTVRAHVLGTVVGRLTGTPVVWTLHDFTFPRMLLPTLARFADGIIFGSQTIAAGHQRQTRFARRRGRTVTIPDGVDFQKLPQPVEIPRARESLRAELLLAQGAPLVGIVGRLVSWKGQRSFLEAAALVHRQRPDAHFGLIGAAKPEDAAYVDGLHHRAVELGLREHIHFLGFRADIHAVIAALDILVHASIEPEPFGRTVIEGLAAGTPVVATDLGGPREIITPEVNGLLFPAGDPDALARSCLRLLNDPDLARRLAAAGVAHAHAHYNLAIVAERTQQVYDAVLARRGRLAGRPPA